MVIVLVGGASNLNGGVQAVLEGKVSEERRSLRVCSCFFRHGSSPAGRGAMTKGSLTLKCGCVTDLRSILSEEAGLRCS